MNKTLQNRMNRLLPGGIPKYIRCYESKDDCLDPYTVVFSGRYRHTTGGRFLYISMSASPFHPQGIGQHGCSETPIDTPTYGHLGRKITFEELPEDCRRLVLKDYKGLWSLGESFFSDG